MSRSAPPHVPWLPYSRPSPPCAAPPPAMRPAYAFHRWAFQGGKMRFSQDIMAQRLLNRSYLIDPWNRLYRDSVLVRFEDGKLNPRATFTALAEFLDLPYTESMTYCSSRKGIDPESLEGNARGFDPPRYTEPTMNLRMTRKGPFGILSAGCLQILWLRLPVLSRVIWWMMPGSRKTGGLLPVWIAILNNHYQI